MKSLRTQVTMLAFIGSGLPTLTRGNMMKSRLVCRPTRRFCNRSQPVTACAKATREEVRRIANLAQLDVSENEIEKLTPEFQKVIDFFNSMEELDLDGIEPMSTPNDARNVLREDNHVMFPEVDAIISEAPSIDREYIRVPKISSEAED